MRDTEATGSMHKPAIVDARGLDCPIPLVRLRQALMVLDPGALAVLLATDPAAPSDVEEFCSASGHELIEVDEEAGLYRISVRKTAG